MAETVLRRLSDQQAERDDDAEQQQLLAETSLAPNASSPLAALHAVGHSPRGRNIRQGTPSRLSVNIAAAVTLIRP